MTTHISADGDTDMHTTHWGGPGEDYRLKKLSATAIGEASSIGSPAPDEACSRVADTEGSAFLPLA